jgi:hypothetical protein
MRKDRQVLYRHFPLAIISQLIRSYQLIYRSSIVRGIIHDTSTSRQGSDVIRMHCLTAQGQRGLDGTKRHRKSLAWSRGARYGRRASSYAVGAM